MAEIKFNDGRMVGGSQRPYIVAELNSSHFGKIETAQDMICAAAEAGCDCVKFQSWTKDTLYSKTYYATNPIMERMVKKFSLDDAALAELSHFAREKQISFSSTAYSEHEIDVLIEKCEVPFLKIASMEINNYDFLTYCAHTGLPLVLSTGMADLQEIDKVVDLILGLNSRLVLLHCISIYPAAPESINLNNIAMLKQRYPQCAVGFSDHSLSTVLAGAAVALGAGLIEKHLTLDKSRMGMDNNMAVEPDEMRILVQNCREIYAALGSSERRVSEAELAQRLKMRRSLAAAKDLKAGSVLTARDITALRPGDGIPVNSKADYIGRKLQRDLSAGELFAVADFA